jgi:adenosylcobinamide-GDP ribazoletransferase
MRTLLENVVNMFRAFLIAVQFLTCIPITVKGKIKPEDNGHALLFYPLVGLILGLILYTVAAILEPSNLSAAIILSVWVICTGALHLDGLADSADAWMGGHSDPERTLTIMKDPASGVIAVVTLILVLLLKWTALQTLLLTDGLLIIFAPVIARMMVLGLIMSTPYARVAGLGADMVKYLPVKAAIIILISMFFLLVFMQWKVAVSAVIISTLLSVALRYMMLKRIKGFTGDTAGALIEIIETVVVVLLATSMTVSVYSQ